MNANCNTKNSLGSKAIGRLLFLLPLLFFISLLNAQGIYEIKYKFNEKDKSGNQVLGQEYTSIVFYYDESSPNNVMRTRFYDQVNGWSVVEQKIKPTQQTTNGENYWVLGGKDPKYISKVTNDAKYNADQIVLSKSPSETYYRPDYVFDNQNNRGIITSFKVLNSQDVDNAYLSPFLWHWPDKNNTTTTKRTETKNNNKGTVTQYTGNLSNCVLHLILVSNSNDANLGTGFAANHRKIKSLFSDAASSVGMKLDLVEVLGDNFNKQNVYSAISNIRTNPNDVMIFYYSGHGFRFSDQKTDWPQMDLRSGVYEDFETHTLNLGDDVYMMLAKKNPRLLMVIGECCNVNAGVGTPQRSDPVTMAPSGNVMNSIILKNLFSAKGKVLLATSKPFESSWYYTSSGGYFCNSFMSCFLNNVGFTNGSTANWKDIFTNAMNQTIETAKQSTAAEEQIPIYYFDLN